LKKIIQAQRQVAINVPIVKDKVNGRGEPKRNVSAGLLVCRKVPQLIELKIIDTKKADEDIQLIPSSGL
jgi:hypothetical protein